MPPPCRAGPIGDKRLPMVDVSAARGKDGKLDLAIVNTDPGHAVQVVTNLTGTAQGRILTGFAMDAHNSFDAAQHGASGAVQRQHRGGKLSFDMPPSRWRW